MKRLTPHELKVIADALRGEIRRHRPSIDAIEHHTRELLDHISATEGINL